MNTFSIAVSKRLREIGCEKPKVNEIVEIFEVNSEIFPSYTLHDIFRLMPKIGEILSFNEIEKTCEIADVFLWGDYPEAEKVLLDLLKEHE